MDAQRFDALTRRLALSRRRAIRGLLAGAMSAGLASRSERGLAACTVVGQACVRNDECCQGSRCAGGRCRCRDGLTECERRCRRLDTEPAHCGACDNACRPSETCCGGKCVDLDRSADHCGECGRQCHQICNEMKDGTVVCLGEPCCDGGQCIADLTSNLDHCGACHNACAAGEFCDGSQCVSQNVEDAD